MLLIWFNKSEQDEEQLMNNTAQKPLCHSTCHNERESKPSWF
jgi:hypothetical protein